MRYVIKIFEVTVVFVLNEDLNNVHIKENKKYKVFAFSCIN